MNTPSPMTWSRRWTHRLLGLFAAAAVVLAANPAQAVVGVTPAGTPASQYLQSSTLSSVTVPAGTNRLLVVTASDAGSPTPPSAVTFNGAGMQLVVSATDSLAASDSIWVLPLGTSASPTTANVVITATGTVERFIAASVYEGVDQSTPAIAGPTFGNGLGTNLGSSLVVSSAAGNLVYDVFDTFRNAGQAAVVGMGGAQTLVHTQSGVVTAGVSAAGFAHYSTSIAAGAASVTMTWTSDADAVLHATMSIKFAPPTAPTPSVTNSATSMDTQSTTGLVITPNSGLVTHFKITAITNGTLYKNDGSTAIANNGFITVAEGAAGLKFTPTTSFIGNASFAVAGANDSGGSGLGPTATATILVGSSIAAGDLVIREFRERGLGGATDEYIEIANRTLAAVTIAATDGSAGFGIAAQNAGSCPGGTAQLLATIPNGTVIPVGGAYLAAHNAGYSLSGYGGAGAATANATWSVDLCDGSGIGLFRSSTSATLATMIDAVGFGAISTTPYLEGPGLPSAWGAITVSGQYAFVRKAPFRTGGVVQYSNDNTADFVFVSPDAAIYSTVQSSLGTPGPQNLASPATTALGVALADPAAMVNSVPNRLQSGNYVYFRRLITNNTPSALTTLKFRIVDLSTLFGEGYNPPVQADLRGIDTSDVVITLTDLSTPTAKGMALEAPSIAFSATGKGAGYNASLTVNIGGSLPSGNSIYLNIGMRIAKSGQYYFMLLPETLPN